jgi:5-methylcytosine-specific restriction endonuclease McrA
MAASSPSSFYAEAQFQRTCAVCGAAGAFDAHHVVSKQRIKRLSPPTTLQQLLYDPRNALRLCERCHSRYTNRVMKINTKLLKDQNICFIWEVLGPAGRNLLERDYTGTERRYTLHEENGCPLCQ